MARKTSILGQTFAIDCVDGLDADQAAVGRTYCNQGRIELDGRAADDTQGAVLVHEVIEVINYNLEFKLKHSTITALSTALYSWVRDNPALVVDIVKGRPIVKRGGK